jgi:hypothetical protein
MLEICLLNCLDKTDDLNRLAVIGGHQLLLMNKPAGSTIANKFSRTTITMITHATLHTQPSPLLPPPSLSPCHHLCHRKHHHSVVSMCRSKKRDKDTASPRDDELTVLDLIPVELQV